MEITSEDLAMVSFNPKEALTLGVSGSASNFCDERGNEAASATWMLDSDPELTENEVGFDTIGGAPLNGIILFFFFAFLPIGLNAANFHDGELYEEPLVLACPIMYVALIDKIHGFN